MIPEDVAARLAELARTTPHSSRSLASAWLYLHRRDEWGDRTATELLRPHRFAWLVSMATSLGTDPLSLAQYLLTRAHHAGTADPDPPAIDGPLT